ncbi:MAG: hypothetical protein CMP63_04915 [Flavobacteriales bacterium]|nr:hypothetical protein [Flavobacteriales bacterium]
MNLLYLGDINSVHDFKWVTYFSLQKKYTVFFVTELENYNLLSPEKKSILQDANIITLPPIFNFSLSSIFQTYKSIRLLRGYIKKYNIDIFHALFGSPQAIWLNFLPKKGKKIITTRGSDVLVLLRSVCESSGIKNKILKKLLILGFKKADYITSTSDLQISFLQSLGIKPSKNKLIKTGVDIQKIIKQNPLEKVNTKKEKFIFSARYISEVYNMHYQIDAIKRLPKNILNDFSFLFVKKPGDESKYFQQIISELEAVPGLKFDVCENLTQSQMWATIKSSELTYMVPKSDGTPNTALECMASKTPFIMGDLNYNEELFGGVSLIADLSTSKSLTDKIILALKDYPKKCLDLGFNKVSEFGSREIEMSKLERLYESL